MVQHPAEPHMCNCMTDHITQWAVRCKRSLYHFKTFILPKRWLLLVCDAVCTGNCVPTYTAPKYKAPLKRRKAKPLVCIFICHDDGRGAISWNVGTVLTDYRASHFMRPQNFTATALTAPYLTKMYILVVCISRHSIFMKLSSTKK